MTVNMTTIARPYAVAAFEYAMQKNALPAWEQMLEVGAAITEDANVQKMLTLPAMTTSAWTSMYCDVLGSLLDSEKTNFIHLLADYHRLSALPEIAALFKLYRAAAEKKLTVQVTSASELSADYQQKLIQALTLRLKRQISLECHIDADLLGGAVIAAGDAVIDGSVRGKLNRMIEFIS